MTPAPVVYAPRPGSIGERSLAYLREHGRALMRDVADGIDADPGAMVGSLALCVQHGLILRTVVNGDIYLSAPPTQIMSEVSFDLNLEAGEAHPSSDAAPAQPSAAAQAARVDLPAITKAASDLASASRGPAELMASFPPPSAAPTHAPAPAPASSALVPKPRHFAFGLFNDGRFVIEVGDGSETLTREETEELWRWIHAIERPFQ